MTAAAVEQWAGSEAVEEVGGAGSEPASPERSATVERLRDQIRRLQAAPRSYLSVLRTGVERFDRLMPGGGLPLGQAVELWGEAASGRTSLALRAVAAATREERLCAYVDGPQELYPPAASALGVELERMLIVRPRAPKHLVWTAVQLLRSGAFACVVLDLTHTGVRLHLVEGRKLAEAAQKGGALLLLLTPPDAPGDGMVRLKVEARGPEGLEVELVRSRQGGRGGTTIGWEALFPREAPTYRYFEPGDPDAPPMPEPLPPSLEPEKQHFHRVRSSHLRDGSSGITGLSAQRPGRDCSFPPLGSALGS